MIAKYTVSVLLAGAFAVLSVCFGAQPVVVDDASLVAAGASPYQWLTIGRDYAETRFFPAAPSERRRNVAGLSPVNCLKAFAKALREE